jgi:hypothetical protein
MQRDKRDFREPRSTIKNSLSLESNDGKQREQAAGADGAVRDVWHCHAGGS